MNQARAILWAQWRSMRNFFPRTGVGWTAAVAEEAGAGLASNAYGLMPLQRIDMTGTHRHLLVFT